VTLHIEVRVFGGLADHVGGSRTTVDVPDPATVGGMREALLAAHPSLAALLPRTKVAVNLAVADDDQRIPAGSEVALLPPVAGGAVSPGTATITGLREPPFDVDATVAAVTDGGTGGTAVFLGTVRDHAPDLDDVVALEYSAYPAMAERVLTEIADELRTAHPQLRGLALLHAVGELGVGAHTILIVCSAGHRSEAFDACRDALERVKDRVPIWKREITSDGTHRWVGLPDGSDEEASAGSSSP
jgi:MoaE-MoaD fusion protein